MLPNLVPISMINSSRKDFDEAIKEIAPFFPMVLPNNFT